jgi:hypothetical protein
LSPPEGGGVLFVGSASLARTPMVAALTIGNGRTW